jgi:hypothetical protein
LINKPKTPKRREKKITKAKKARPNLEEKSQLLQKKNQGNEKKS